MGMFDRTYWKDGNPGGSFGLSLPRPSRTVVILMGACTVLFFATLATGGEDSPLYTWLALATPSWFQAWRWISFQFMHGDPRHFLFNMMGLYFFGPALDRRWGARRFLAFYLLCGVASGLMYAVFTLAWPAFLGIPLVGASGAILGCLAACAILEPGFLVFIIPIRWFAGFLVVLYVLGILWGAQGSPGAKMQALQDAAHLGGMLAGGLLALRWPSPGRLGGSLRAKLQRGAWRRKQEAEARRREEVDRILDKVHREGVGSLTSGEKKTLQEETERSRDGRGRP